MEQNEWMDNFFNKSCLNISNEIDKLMNSNKFINNIDVKIEEMEVDFSSKMNEIKNTFENNDINKLYNNKNSLEVLQKEVEIIKLISKYSLQNNKLEFEFIITCLKYLLSLSELLRNRLHQQPININKNYMGKNNIVRCSYKFCNYKEECVYNYNFGKKTNQCYQDHYVHNMVSHDVSSLISYIEANYKTNSLILHNKEILKTVNTLSFVIGHMEGELRAKCLYNDPKDWEKYHYINVLK
jgi:hypothetical protein